MAPSHTTWPVPAGAEEAILEDLAANDPEADGEGDPCEDDYDDADQDGSWDMAEGIDEELTKQVLQKTSR
jgi:hypothetical protein